MKITYNSISSSWSFPTSSTQSHFLILLVPLFGDLISSGILAQPQRKQENAGHRNKNDSKAGTNDAKSIKLVNRKWYKVNKEYKLKVTLGIQKELLVSWCTNWYKRSQHSWRKLVLFRYLWISDYYLLWS